MAFTAAANPTLIDIAKANGVDEVTGLIDETTQAHPELTVVPARTIAGINYKTLVRTTLPTVAFRNVNEGYAETKGKYENRLIETYTLNPKWGADKAVADRYEDGAGAYISMEATATMEAAMQHLAEQFYYGRGTAVTCGLVGSTTTKGDAKGFFGLLELSEAAGLTLSGNRLVITASGVAGTATTADSASSCYMLRTGVQDVKWVWGTGGSLEISEVTEQRILDGSSLPFTAYCQELLAYPGLQIGSIYSFGRIGDITEDASCTLTDKALASLYSRFPVGKKPNMILMTRRSQRMLRDTRLTATGMTILAGGEPVDFPESWMGLPIYITDAISDAEEIDLIT